MMTTNSGGSHSSSQLSASQIRSVHNTEVNSHQADISSPNSNHIILPSLIQKKEVHQITSSTTMHKVKEKPHIPNEILKAPIDLSLTDNSGMNYETISNLMPSQIITSTSINLPSPIAPHYLTIQPTPPIQPINSSNFNYGNSSIGYYNKIHSSYSSMPNAAPGSKMSRSKFTPQEDATLKELVAQFGSSKWSEIASKLPNRTGRQCRERWKNYLAPGIQNGPWTLDEDALLVQKVKDLGTMWSKMVRFFPGRTDVNLKNRWVTLKYKKGAHYGEDMPNSTTQESNNDEKTEIKETVPLQPSELQPVNYNSANYTYYQNPSTTYPQVHVTLPPLSTIQPPQMPRNFQTFIGNSITIEGTHSFPRINTATSTDPNQIVYETSNLNHKKLATLEPSIILSQPRWLLNNSENVESPEEHKINFNSNMDLQSRRFMPTQHRNLEIPLLVAMPLEPPSSRTST